MESIEDAFPSARVSSFVGRRGSFEVEVKKGKTSEAVWSGLKLGPPRKLKFPDSEKLLPLIKKAVLKHHLCPPSEINY
jgi:hypothetical protein